MAAYFHFSSSDEELEDLLDEVSIPKTNDYFEETVPKFSDQQYIEHFRVSRRVSQELGDKFATSNYFHSQTGDLLKISAQKFIAVFLWFAGNEAASYRVVADRFNISQSSLFKIIRRVTYFLSNLSPEIIVWPNDEEKREIEEYFRERQFPSTIGVIDGTHFRIDRPSEDPDSYLNRKHFHSIQAQVVCDHRKKIRDIFVGYPGSVHDSRVLKASPLYGSLAEKCQNFFILGDSGYPCLPNLLTPYKDFGQLSRRQRNYNHLLSKNRYIIEHSFGLMKQKFRQLYHLKLRKIRDAVHFIRACAVLHNIAIDDALDILEPELVPEENVGGEYVQDDGDGVRRRLEVMNTLPMLI